MYLEISQKSQENTCVKDSFLIKLQAMASNFIKKSLWYRYFLVNFAKFLRIPFSQNTSGRLLLLCTVQRKSRCEISTLLKNMFCESSSSEKAAAIDGSAFEKVATLKR